MGRFWELLSGSVLAWLLLYKADVLSKFKLWVDKYLVRIIHSKDVASDGSNISNLMSFFGLLLLTYGVIRINENLTFPSKWALIPVLGAVLIIASGSKAWLNRVFLMNPIAVWFGLISYPLYLWHWPILSFLKITETETPHKNARIAAVMLSILLAWLTYEFIEKPIRFGFLRQKMYSTFIALILFVIGGFGYFVSVNSWEDVLFKRKGFEHALGSSLKWYRGSGDWLFLGNDYNNTVAKRRLAIKPTDAQIGAIVDRFSILAEVSAQSNTQVVLLVGPNKSSVYTEYLPKELVPSNKRYSTFITDELRKIQNLKIEDPTDLLIKSKSSKGFLYYRTDTHWNQKGAYIAFRALMEGLNLRYPNVKFSLDSSMKGDLITISKLTDFPIHSDDNWKFEVLADTQIFREELKNQPKNPFGWKGRITNNKALNDMSVWVIGDSFTSTVVPYIEASFKEVSYIGHWNDMLNSLPLKLLNANQKPNLILIVIVERSF